MPHDRAVAGYSARFMEAAAIGAGERVLDIGCGTGQTTRDAARAAAAGSALGVDLSAAMLGMALEPAARLAIANSISTPLWGDAAKIDEALRPLLQDEDIGVRQTAAYSLAMLLGSRAGDEVTRAMREGLKSTDEDLRGLALSALKNIGSDPKDPSGRVTPNSLTG